VDYTAEGYFPSRHADLIESIPSGFVDRPATLSVCELEMLHQECVDRINMYRSGELLFSDGGVDADIAANQPSPLLENTGGNQCSSHQALGDLNTQQQQGGCGHITSGTCPFGGIRAQNSCCPNGGGEQPIWTYESVRDSMFGCLQGMWDEGKNGGGGHNGAMKNPDYSYVSCGFAWTSDGRLLITQDFTSADQSDETCSCDGKEPGSSDGCGGVCTACSEPEESLCVDQSVGPVISPACTGPAVGNSFGCTCDDHMRLAGGVLGGCEVASVAAACPLTCGTCPEPAAQCPSSDDDDDDDEDDDEQEDTASTTTTTTVTTPTTTVTTTITVTTTTADPGCQYVPYTNTAVRMQGTGGQKLRRSSFSSDAEYLSECKKACDADLDCGGFVDDPTDRRGRMCKPKTASSGYPKSRKTFYRKSNC